MKRMRIMPECYACLERLVELAAGLATDDPTLQARAAIAGRAVIAREFGPEAISAFIANRFHWAIQEITGNPDPFSVRKLTETATLKRLLQQVAGTYDDNLNSLLQLAVAGNTVDFFRDEEEVVQEILNGVQFRVSHLASLKEKLAAIPGLLLYLADNAGEQFFDAPLLAHLRRHGWEVHYVVKGGPIQNDLTREDLSASGMHEVLQPVSDIGARTVGLDLNDIGAEFRKLWARARLIIAKGMGHFETMSHLGDPRVFFLLQAKCAPVAQALGVPRLSFVLAHAAAVLPDEERP